MTFLNATLLFGVAAISIPIALHLIARREPRKVVFPSIRLLTQRFESNRSRIRIRRWWLLALRIAAIAAFALALARPAVDRALSVTWLTIGLVAVAGVVLLVLASIAWIRGQSPPLAYGLVSLSSLLLLAAMLWGGYTYASGPALSLDEGQPVAIAIVLDNSPTSSWATRRDDRLERMREIATWMIARLPATSRIAIVDRSSRPITFELDAAGAIRRVEQLRALQLTQPLAARLEAAARLVRSSDLPNRQLLVISDLSVASWQPTTDDPAVASLFTEEPPIDLTIYDLSDFKSGNRSLAAPTIADPTPPQDQPIPISTSVRLSENATAALSVTAELQLYQPDPTLPVIRDGELRLPELRSVDRTNVQLSPGGTSNLLLTAPPLDVGTHHGRIRLIGDDPLTLDDVRYFTVRVLQPAPLLLVADDSDEARVMELAISDEFAVDRIGFADFTVVRLEDYPTIFAIDPPRDLIEDVSVTEYLQTGGNLLVCLGPAAGEDALDPPTIPALLRRWRPPPPGTFFQLSSPTHPLLAPLAEIAGGVPWANFRVQQYWQVESGEEHNVLIRYAGTEHAALTERVFAGQAGNQGRLLTLTTPLPALAPQTRSWNELFSGSEPWPAFLLVRQFAEYLSGRGDQVATTLVGRPQLLPLPPADPTDEPATSRRLQLFPPESIAPVPLEVPPDSDDVLIQEVSQAGTYWLRGTGSVEGFSANLPDSAIDLNRITESDLNQFFGPDRYRLTQQREDIELAEGEAGNAVSLFSPMLLMALIAFLLEQVLGNRFYRAAATRSRLSGTRAVAA